MFSFVGVSIFVISLMGLDIPIFSENMNWDMESTLNDLSKLIDIGFGFFQMTLYQQQLYHDIYMDILQFFHSTKQWPLHNIPNQSLNFTKWKQDNIFYGYFSYQSIEPYQQVRCFMMPTHIHNDINMMEHDSNPFKNNPKIFQFSESISQNALTILKQILKYIMVEKYNITNIELINDYSNQIIGDNPSKHFGFNYYNSNEINNNITYGVQPHKDSDFISMLAVTNYGLSIQYNGSWFNIPYYNDRLIMNFGSMFEKFTNNMVKAVNHYVPIITYGKRLSFGIFLNADMNGNVYELNKNGLTSLDTILDHTHYAFNEYLSQNKNDL